MDDGTENEGACKKDGTEEDKNASRQLSADAPGALSVSAARTTEEVSWLVDMQIDME